MEAMPVIIEIASFICLVIVYYKLCADRDVSAMGRFVEILSLYGMSIWAILGNLKFTFWALGIAAIGLVKIITTKKAKIERRDKGFVN